MGRLTFGHLIDTCKCARDFGRNFFGGEFGARTDDVGHPHHHLWLLFFPLFCVSPVCVSVSVCNGWATPTTTRLR